MQVKESQCPGPSDGHGGRRKACGGAVEGGPSVSEQLKEQDECQELSQ